LYDVDQSKQLSLVSTAEESIEKLDCRSYGRHNSLLIPRFSGLPFWQLWKVFL